MSPKAQLIAIGLACGWRNAAVEPYQDWQHDEIFSQNTRTGLPDYLNDLNAMHEAEKIIVLGPETVEGDALRKRWDIELQKVVGPYNKMHHANATQRSEAFLRTIGKWVEP